MKHVEEKRISKGMARAVSIGNQDFEKIRTNNNFYIDKTDFIREWWEAADEVTLITRPRRFGKTLNMSMLEKFFLLIIRAGGICSKGWQSGRKNLLKGEKTLKKIINIENYREHTLLFS